MFTRNTSNNNIISHMWFIYYIYDKYLPSNDIFYLFRRRRNDFSTRCNSIQILPEETIFVCCCTGFAMEVCCVFILKSGGLLRFYFKKWEVCCEAFGGLLPIRFVNLRTARETARLRTRLPPGLPARLRTVSQFHTRFNYCARVVSPCSHFFKCLLL